MIEDQFMNLEYKVNEYLELKLLDGKTYIFVKGKRFIQCIRLVLQIPIADVDIYDEI